MSTGAAAMTSELNINATRHTANNLMINLLPRDNRPNGDRDSS
jgi:hypothetical protein